MAMSFSYVFLFYRKEEATVFFSRLIIIIHNLSIIGGYVCGKVTASVMQHKVKNYRCRTIFKSILNFFLLFGPK